MRKHPPGSTGSAKSGPRRRGHSGTRLHRNVSQAQDGIQMLSKRCGTRLCTQRNGDTARRNVQATRAHGCTYVLYTNGTYIPLTNYSASRARNRKNASNCARLSTACESNGPGQARSVFRAGAHDESKSFGITVTRDLDFGAKGAPPGK